MSSHRPNDSSRQRPWLILCGKNLKKDGGYRFLLRTEEVKRYVKDELTNISDLIKEGHGTPTIKSISSTPSL
jgi:hypothetical protein